MKTLNKEQITWVYSGVNGKCCCGCAGKYSYASAHKEESSKEQGYEVNDESISDRSISIIVNKINKEISKGNFEMVDDTQIAVELDNRLYMAKISQNAKS